MIKISQIKLGTDAKETELNNKIKKILRLKKESDFSYSVLRKSLDSRKKDNLLYVYSVLVKLNGIDEKSLVLKLNNNEVSICNEEKYIFPDIKKNINHRIAVTGFGPAGIFCGLFLARAGFKPVIYERGTDIHERTRIVKHFWDTGELDLSTNVQFGEGGAGTFSDGKLNTIIKEKAGRIRKVLETFVEFGAPADILYNSKPHIGTDRLSVITEKMRNEIIRLGGTVRFNSKVSDFHIENGKIKGIRINDEYDEEYDTVILAPGHSARDTFEMLIKKGIPMETKAFAVGVRIEHPQSLINGYAYGSNGLKLPPADYKLTAKSGQRGVYSFCMCPGGYVVNASSENNMTCVNGMSYSGRDGHNANSAIVVTVNPDDFNNNNILAGMYFQRELEKKAYIAGKGGIPYQLNEDFIRGRATTGYADIKPCILGKYAGADLREIFPEYISETIIDGMKSFDKIIHGFNTEHAVLSGVESRTSSPVRILRNDLFESISVRGLYPCGEGAGYAGGITSAAVDGIKVAEAVALS